MAHNDVVYTKSERLLIPPHSAPEKEDLVGIVKNSEWISNPHDDKNEILLMNARIQTLEKHLTENIHKTWKQPEFKSFPQWTTHVNHHVENMDEIIHHAISGLHVGFTDLKLCQKPMVYELPSKMPEELPKGDKYNDLIKEVVRHLKTHALCMRNYYHPKFNKIPSNPARDDRLDHEMEKLKELRNACREVNKETQHRLWLLYKILKRCYDNKKNNQGATKVGLGLGDIFLVDQDPGHQGNHRTWKIQGMKFDNPMGSTSMVMNGDLRINLCHVQINVERDNHGVIDHRYLTKEDTRILQESLDRTKTFVLSFDCNVRIDQTDKSTNTTTTVHRKLNHVLELNSYQKDHWECMLYHDGKWLHSSIGKYKSRGVSLPFPESSMSKSLARGIPEDVRTYVLDMIFRHQVIHGRPLDKFKEKNNKKSKKNKEEDEGSSDDGLSASDEEDDMDWEEFWLRNDVGVRFFSGLNIGYMVLQVEKKYYSLFIKYTELFNNIDKQDTQQSIQQHIMTNLPLDKKHLQQGEVKWQGAYWISRIDKDHDVMIENRFHPAPPGHYFGVITTPPTPQLHEQVEEEGLSAYNVGAGGFEDFNEEQKKARRDKAEAVRRKNQDKRGRRQQGKRGGPIPSSNPVYDGKKKTAIVDQPPNDSQKDAWVHLCQALEYHRLHIQVDCERKVMENGNGKRLAWQYLRQRVYDIKADSGNHFLWRWFLHAFPEAQAEWTFQWEKYLSQENRITPVRRVARQPKVMADFWYRDFACAGVEHMSDDLYNVLKVEIRREYLACNMFRGMLQDTIDKLDGGIKEIPIDEWKGACTAWINATIFSNVNISQEAYSSLLYQFQKLVWEQVKTTEELWVLFTKEFTMVFNILSKIRVYKFHAKYYYDVLGEFFKPDKNAEVINLNGWTTNTVLPRMENAKQRPVVEYTYQYYVNMRLYYGEYDPEKSRKDFDDEYRRKHNIPDGEYGGLTVNYKDVWKNSSVYVDIDRKEMFEHRYTNEFHKGEYYWPNDTSLAPHKDIRDRVLDITTELDLMTNKTMGKYPMIVNLCKQLIVNRIRTDVEEIPNKDNHPFYVLYLMLLEQISTFFIGITVNHPGLFMINTMFFLWALEWFMDNEDGSLIVNDVEMVNEMGRQMSEFEWMYDRDLIYMMDWPTTPELARAMQNHVFLKKHVLHEMISC